DASTGVFTWTPPEDITLGVYSFTVQVSDGSATDQKSISVLVTEGNQLPVVTRVPPTATANEGSLLTFTAAATGADIPAQTLSFSLVGAPSGATIDPMSGVFTWTPTEAQGPGIYSFFVRVSDGVGHTDVSTTVTVTEVNVAPTLTGVPATASVNEGESLTF